MASRDNLPGFSQITKGVPASNLKTVKVFYVIGFILSLVITVFFSIVWWERSQMPYNDKGRYWDGLVIWHEQAVGVYAILALVSLFLTVIMAIICQKVMRSQNT